ncbi:outer membrane protein assembly factor BamA [candidate division WOR-3 bacterium]|nr:outer membrane protein assembly factor BamA [candidate division WOR-3 bacterium]
MSSLFLALLLATQPVLDTNRIVLLDITAQTSRTDPGLVIRTAGLTPKSVYTVNGFRTALAEAIRKIYELGFFAQIVAETTMIADGVKLNFILEEYPKLKSVQFEGYRLVKKKDLQSKVKLREGEILTDKKIFDLKQELLKMYKQKGFLLVEIKPEKSPPDSTGAVVLTYQIDEGDPVRIRKIEIYGNENFTDLQIKKKLTNKEKTWYRKGQLKEEEFAKDLDRIVEFYKQRGFIEARVLDYDMKYDQGWVDITIYLSEGKKYFFGNFTFQGDSVIAPERLKQLVRYRPGAVYNTKQAQATLSDIYSLYAEEGYIYAQVSPVEQISADTVHITYEIIEGMPAFIRLVQIEGNHQTLDKVIRREISSLPGYPFKRSEVLRSQRDIFNLGFFEDVALDYRRVDTLGAIDLIYKVKEKSFFGTIGAGVSYSAQDQFTGYVELQQPNLLGRGWRTNLKLEKGSKKTNFQLSFTEPWLFDTPTSAGFDAVYLTRDYDYYNKQEISGGISFSRPLPLDYTRAYLGLRVSDAYVPPTSISSSYKPSKLFNVYRDTVHKTSFVPSITLTRDSRDYIYNPLTGSAITYALDLSIGDIRFQRHTIDITQHLPLFWKFGLKGRARFGYITGFSATDTVPLYERFYPGGTGPDGIRGYGERTVGPFDSGYPVGGRMLSIFSLEYKLRLNPQLSFLAFFDAGNTWDRVNQFNLSDLKRGAGIGVRLEIPMLGLIGFDFGYGFDKARPGWEPHFQLGTTF